MPNRSTDRRYASEALAQGLVKPCPGYEPATSPARRRDHAPVDTRAWAHSHPAAHTPPYAAPAGSRWPPPATTRRAITLADYTIGHGGRQVRLGPVAFWTVVGTLIVMAIWSVATATYFAFRDDLLTRLIARQADMQYAYEDRVAELRSQVDRL